MYFFGVLSLFFTNPSFGTSIPITNTIDTKCGGSNINILSPLKEEPKSCHFDNNFLGNDVSDGSKSEKVNEDFTTTIDEEVLEGGNDNKKIDVIGEIKHFKKNRELFCQNNFLHELEEEKRLDGAIDRFCEKYRDIELKGPRFIGLEKEGVFVGMGNIEGEKLFLGRKEGTEMLGFLKKADQQETDQQVFPLVGYFNMNDEGEVKNAGIIFSRSDENVGFSIKTGKGNDDRFFFYIPLPKWKNNDEINKVYEEIRKNKNFKSLGKHSSVKTQVASMFEEVQNDFDQEDVLDFCNELPLPCNIITPQEFYSIAKNERCLMEIIDYGNTVYDEAFSFPIYLNGEERTGLLFFAKEDLTSFDLCFGLQAFEDDRCVFVPLLVVYFSEIGESCLFFDYRDSSNSCEITYNRKGKLLSFNCNFSLSDGKGIVVEKNFDTDKVYIVSPLKVEKIKDGEGQGPSLRGLIKSSESRFKYSKGNTDFSLVLSSSFPKNLCLEIPCSKKEAVFNFVFLPFAYSFSLNEHIKNGDKEIDTLNNFLIVCKNLVLLIKDCVDKNILNIKILKEGKIKMQADFYYSPEVRDVDSSYDFIKKIINSAVSVDGCELPFIVSLGGVKESDWNKNVDSETDAFLTDVFRSSNVEVNSINEDEKEINTDNNINKEKKEKEIAEVSIKKMVNDKIGYKSKNRKKNERRKRKKEKLNSTESKERKTSNKISNGLEQGENIDFKPGEEVTIEYFLEGKDGKEKKEIKYTIEDEKKEFFGEKRRIVILPNEKKLPSKFKNKGSVSDILKSGEKKFSIIHKLLSRALFNLSCAKILKDSSIKLSKIKNVKGGKNRDVFEVYIAHNTKTEIGNQIRLLVAYDKAEKTFYVLDSFCHNDK